MKKKKSIRLDYRLSPSNFLFLQPVEVEQPEGFYGKSVVEMLGEASFPEKERMRFERSWLSGKPVGGI